MSVTADQERRFYDQNYAPHLNAADGALRVDRAILAAQFEDPASSYYERRLLYRTALEKLLAQPVKGCRALDYGCGVGEWGVMLAVEGAHVTLLDLSPVAIEVALRRARASGVAGVVRGVARDASDLSCFADGEFDLIFGSAAVHHTLKYSHAFDELMRVLRPGGRLVLAENWGNNPLLDAARRLRWRISAEPAEAGEGIFFNQEDVEKLRQRMRQVEVTPLNLLAMGKRLFRGRFQNPAVRAIMAGLEGIDRGLLRALPGLRIYCGEAVVAAEK
jgi:SAM-dependent methyltransferase